MLTVAVAGCSVSPDKAAIFEAEGLVIAKINGKVPVAFERERYVVGPQAVCGVAVQRAGPLTERRPFVVQAGVAFVSQKNGQDDASIAAIANAVGC